MHLRKAMLAAGTGAALISTALTAPTGAGASTQLQFFGAAGGSLVRALNSTVISDLTAASAISTFDSNATSHNTLAHVQLNGLLTTDAVTTDAMSRKPLLNGYQTTSKARTADVNLLNGLITVKLVTTTAVATLNGTKASSTVNTAFSGIHIAGAKLPLNIPKNFHVTIPNVASVTLNSALTVTEGTTTAGMGAGLMVTLLRPVGNNDAGTTIYLSPVYSRIGDLDANNTGHTSQGSAFGSTVQVHGSNVLGVRSDPTAPVAVTPGKSNTTSIAAVNLNPALKLGAITDSASGTQTTSLGEAITTSKVAGLNLFNGLITADAVSTTSRVTAPEGSPINVVGSSDLVNLKINGRSIPVDAAPNTTINLLNIATVTVNRQVVGAHSIVVNALFITMTTAAYGLPVGAQIQLAASSASAT